MRQDGNFFFKCLLFYTEGKRGVNFFPETIITEINVE